MSFTFQNPFVYVNNPNNSNAVSLGKMYIGLPDTDPITPANQIPVYAVQPDGSELQIPQPVRTTAGGVVTYGGTPIQLKVSEEIYSVRIDSSANAQLYYTARVELSGGVPEGVVLSINSIKSLEDVTEPAVNTVYEVIGYYEDTTVGGGGFVWEATRPYSDHNGGTVIAPPAIAAWDGTQADIATLLNWTGSGVGCWVRIVLAGTAKAELTIEMFGGVGDGVNSCSIQVQRILDLNCKLIGSYQENYLFSSAISVENQSVDIDLNGSNFIQNGDFPLITIHQNYTNVVNVTAQTQVSIDLLNGDSGALTPTIRLTVSNSSGYAKGDIVKIISSDIVPATDPLDQERNGEFAKVALVEPGFVYLYSYLTDTYTTDVRLIKMQSDKKVIIRNGKVNTKSTAPSTWSRSLINLIGCFEPEIYDISCDFAASEMIEFDSCFSAKTRNISAKRQVTSFANFAYGYTIVEYASEASVHEAPSGYDCRHVYTTGVRSASSTDADVWKFGRTRYSRIKSGFGMNCQNSAFDTHPDAYGVIFESCIAMTPYNGPLGTQRNYQFRGQYGKAINCISIGGAGYYVNGTVNNIDSAKGNQLINCQHDFLPIEQSSSRYAFFIEGQFQPVIGTRIINPVTNQTTGNIPHYYAINAAVTVDNPTVDAEQTVDFNSSIFQAFTDATFIVNDGIIDCTGSPALGLRICKLLSDTARVEMYGTRFIGGNLSYLADFAISSGVDGNGTFIAKGVITDQVLTIDTSGGDGGVGVTNVGTTATVMVDYSIDGNSTSNPNVWTESYTAGGSKTIPTYFRGGDRLVTTLTTTLGIPQIDSLGKGAFIGQLWTLTVSPTSAGAMNLVDGGTNISIGSDELISQGRGFSLVWNGSTWTGA